MTCPHRNFFISHRAQQRILFCCPAAARRGESGALDPELPAPSTNASQRPSKPPGDFMIFRCAEQSILAGGPTITRLDWRVGNSELLASCGDCGREAVNAPCDFPVGRRAQQRFFLAGPGAMFWVWLRHAQPGAPDLYGGGASLELRS